MNVIASLIRIDTNLVLAFEILYFLILWNSVPNQIIILFNRFTLRVNNDLIEFNRVSKVVIQMKGSERRGQSNNIVFGFAENNY